MIAFSKCFHILLLTLWANCGCIFKFRLVQIHIKHYRTQDKSLSWPQLPALVCGWKLYWKNYMASTKIFHCRPSKQFVNKITLFYDGKCHYKHVKVVCFNCYITLADPGVLGMCDPCNFFHFKAVFGKIFAK